MDAGKGDPYLPSVRVQTSTATMGIVVEVPFKKTINRSIICGIFFKFPNLFEIYGSSQIKALNMS